MEFSRGTYVQQKRQADLSAFGGRAARGAATYRAFVPSGVRDIDLALTGTTAADIADAEAALVRLHRQDHTVSGLDSLTRSLLRSEAVASSWIEALQVSHRKLAQAERDAPGSRYDEARRVLGNVRAMAEAVAIGAASAPFTVDDILRMHALLLSASNVREDRERAGHLRTEPVFIGGTTPMNREYVGPPADRVPELMADLVAFLNERQDLSPTVVAAIAHAQFETIHPFHDGNGRVGRCLIHTLLRRGAPSDVLPPISLALKQPNSRYVDGLNAFRRNDLNAWLSVFATAVTFAAGATLGLGQRAADLQGHWLAAITARRIANGRRRPRSDAAVVSSVAVLADMPAFRTRDLAERLRVTWRAAQDAVEELEQIGIVRQTSAGKGNRLYEVREVFSLLDDFEQNPEQFRALR